MKYRDFFINESWKNYVVSTNPQTLLYDFYVLSYLTTLPLQPSEKGFTGTLIGRDPQEIKLDIQNAENLLLPALQKQLSNALFIAICAEIRHVLDNRQDWSKYAKNKLVKNYIRNYKALRELPSEFKPTRGIVEPRLQPKEASYTQSYQAAIKAINESGSTKEEFARIASDMFRTMKWSSAYGGEKWAQIADAYNLLNKTPQTNQQLQVAIDHAYDLQHNTGAVLNKVKNYYIDNSIGWLSMALDFKANLKSVYDLLPKCSSDMRKLALEAFKTAGVKKQKLQTNKASGAIKSVSVGTKKTKFKIGDFIKYKAGSGEDSIEINGIITSVNGIDDKSSFVNITKIITLPQSPSAVAHDWKVDQKVSLYKKYMTKLGEKTTPLNLATDGWKITLGLSDKPNSIADAIGKRGAIVKKDGSPDKIVSVVGIVGGNKLMVSCTGVILTRYFDIDDLAWMDWNPLTDKGNDDKSSDYPFKLHDVIAFPGYVCEIYKIFPDHVHLKVVKTSVSREKVNSIIEYTLRDFEREVVGTYKILSIRDFKIGDQFKNLDTKEVGVVQSTTDQNIVIYTLVDFDNTSKDPIYKQINIKELVGNMEFLHKSTKKDRDDKKISNFSLVKINDFVDSLDAFDLSLQELLVQNNTFKRKVNKLGLDQNQLKTFVKTISERLTKKITEYLLDNFNLDEIVMTDQHFEVETTIDKLIRLHNKSKRGLKNLEKFLNDKSIDPEVLQKLQKFIYQGELLKICRDIVIKLSRRIDSPLRNLYAMVEPNGIDYAPLAINVNDAVPSDIFDLY